MLKTIFLLVSLCSLRICVRFIWDATDSVDWRKCVMDAPVLSKESIILRGNGRIDVNDATTVQKHIAQLLTLTGDLLTAADANKDGKVDVNDVTTIQKYVAKIIDKF